MNKEEFLSVLEKELEVLPEEKRKKAMSYYKACFDSVDKLSEQAIIFKLGSPKLIANNIIKEHQKSIKFEAMPPNKQKFFMFFDNMRKGKFDYELNKKNIIIAIIVILTFIFLILPILSKISIVLFAVLCSVFGVLLAIVLLPLIIFCIGVGLVFVSIFSLWDIKNSILPLIVGAICIVSSFFIGKFMLKYFKKLYSKLKV